MAPAFAILDLRHFLRRHIRHTQPERAEHPQLQDDGDRT